jgi:hypothetical protein
MQLLWLKKYENSATLYFKNLETKGYKGLQV